MSDSVVADCTFFFEGGHVEAGTVLDASDEVVELFPGFFVPTGSDGIVVPTVTQSEDLGGSDGSTGDSAGETTTVKRPAKKADKDAWIDYAIAQGAGPEDVEGASKAELVARYG